jgi:hypothetical protein
MRLKNYTSLETDWLRKAVAAVKPSNVTNFDISIKNSSNGNKGKAYWNGCSFHSTRSPLVTIGLASRTRFPYRTAKGNGYIQFTLYTLREVAVFIIAHELRHLWQAKVKKGWRVWGARGQFSERDADAYAIRMTRAYRRGELDC